MLLSCRFLNDVQNVNSFEHVNQLECFQGDAVDVYFQLIDASKNKPDAGFVPSGVRYCPAVSAALSCTFENIDNAKKVTRAASQPFPTSDPSIWLVQMLPSDNIAGGTVGFRLQLTEGAVVRRAFIQGSILVTPQFGV